MIITIIIATYNAANTIKRCIDSIISQKTADVELIVVDGNSTDNTVEILKSYGNDIDLIISEKDKGIYDAWNKRIKNASGDWIMFLGADDTLIENALNSYITFITESVTSDVDYLCSKNEYLSTQSVFIKHIGKPYIWSVQLHKMDVAHVASLHNRNLFKEVGVYDLRYPICADYELLLRKKENLKTCFFDSVVARMQIGGVSFSVKAIKEAYHIRKQHKTISGNLNRGIFLWQVFVFYMSRLKTNILLSLK